jgi:hypothetical protein
MDKLLCFWYNGAVIFEFDFDTWETKRINSLTDQGLKDAIYKLKQLDTWFYVVLFCCMLVLGMWLVIPYPKPLSMYALIVHLGVVALTYKVGEGRIQARTLYLIANGGCRPAYRYMRRLRKEFEKTANQLAS